MDTTWLVAVLALVTLGAVLIFALVSKKKTDDRRHSDQPKSTLAADAPNVTAPGKKPVDT
jgi:hypothetical protein